jgi:16S rRNA (cytosine967-C5)-methyltransferase
MPDPGRRKKDTTGLYAEESVARISARDIALQVLTQYPGRSKPDDLLEQLLVDHQADRRDRALATQIVSGTIKSRNRVDYIIKHLSRKSRVVSPVVLNILRLSLYQLIFLDRVPAYGATSEGVELAKKYADHHQASYVNAILRRYLRERDRIEFPEADSDPVKHISILYSHPAWLVKRWLRRYSVSEVIELASANNRVPTIGLRVNRMRAGLPEVEASLKDDGGEVVSKGFAGTPHIYVRGVSPVEATEAFRTGLVQVQDASSTLVGLLLSPGEGDRVVDLCSAPGGKVTHLFEITQGRAVVVAGDISFARLLMVRKNASRLGHTGMLYAVSDGRAASLQHVDYLLVDAPCTGLGVLSRRWDLRWSKKEKDVARMASYQKELLSAAIEIVKPGGVVVYSTCSIEPEENESVVTAVMTQRRDLRLEDAGQFVGQSVVYKKGMVQTLPHVHNVDGVFAARLRRI